MKSQIQEDDVVVAKSAEERKAAEAASSSLHIEYERRIKKLEARIKEERESKKTTVAKQHMKSQIRETDATSDKRKIELLKPSNTSSRAQKKTINKAREQSSGMSEAEIHKFLTSLRAERRKTEWELEKISKEKLRVQRVEKLWPGLKKLAANFKLDTPMPRDILEIISKDPVKQKDITF